MNSGALGGKIEQWAAYPHRRPRCPALKLQLLRGIPPPKWGVVSQEKSVTMTTNTTATNLE